MVWSNMVTLWSIRQGLWRAGLGMGARKESKLQEDLT